MPLLFEKTCLIHWLNNSLSFLNELYFLILRVICGSNLILISQRNLVLISNFIFWNLEYQMTMNIKSRFFSPPSSNTSLGYPSWTRPLSPTARSCRWSDIIAPHPPSAAGRPSPTGLAGAVNPPPNKTLCCNI